MAKQNQRGRQAPQKPTEDVASVEETTVDEVVTPEAEEENPSETVNDMTVAIVEAGVPEAPTEPEATPEPAPEPAPVDPTPEPVAPVGFDVPTMLRAKYKALGALPDVVNQIIRRMDNYVQSMGPRCPITTTEGAIHQRNLYNTYLLALGAGNGDHRLAIEVILMYFFEHRNGALSERMAFRFIDVARLLPEAALSFQRLTHLFIKTADGSSRRAALRSIDMRQVVEKLSAQQQQMLLDYYV